MATGALRRVGPYALLPVQDHTPNYAQNGFRSLALYVTVP